MFAGKTLLVVYACLLGRVGATLFALSRMSDTVSTETGGYIGMSTEEGLWKSDTHVIS